MNGVILAAGDGTRARPLTSDRPKCLLEVAGRSILERQLDALERHGIRACVVVGYMKESVIESCEGREVDFVVNTRHETTGALGSLWCAREYLRAGFYQLFGDVCFEDAALDALVLSEETTSLAVNVGPCRACDALVRVEGGLVVEAGASVRQETATGDYIMGKFDARAAEILTAEMQAADEQGAMLGDFIDGVQRAIDRGCRMGVVDVSAYDIVEIDCPEDHRRANEVFGRASGRPISASAPPSFRGRCRS